MRQTWSRQTNPVKGMRRKRKRCPECDKCLKRTEYMNMVSHRCNTKDCVKFGQALSCVVNQND